MRTPPGGPPRKRGERKTERRAENKDLRKTERDHGWGTVNRNFEREEWQERDQVMQKKNDQGR